MEKSTITVKDEGVLHEVELGSAANSLSELTGSMEDRRDMYRMGKPQKLKVRVEEELLASDDTEECCSATFASCRSSVSQ